MTTDNRTPSRTLPEPFLAISLDGEGAHPAAGEKQLAAAAVEQLAAVQGGVGTEGGQGERGQDGDGEQAMAHGGSP